MLDSYPFAAAVDAGVKEEGEKKVHKWSDKL